MTSYWARLAEIKIGIDISPWKENEYWSLDNCDNQLPRANGSVFAIYSSYLLLIITIITGH